MPDKPSESGVRGGLARASSDVFSAVSLLVRYNGIGKPLSNDEREILLFALYNESEERGGMAAEAARRCQQIWKNQRIVQPSGNPSGLNEA